MKSYRTQFHRYMRGIATSCFFSILLTMLSGTLSANSYNNYSETFNWSLFVVNPLGGGGHVKVDIVNDVLTVHFSAGFSSQSLKTGNIVQLNTSPTLPDMTLGTLNVGNYTVSIQGGWLRVTGYGGASGFATLFTENLPSTVPDLSQWLTSPNGGEVFVKGETFPVTVNTSLYNPGFMHIQYYQNGTAVTGFNTGGTSGRVVGTSLREPGEYKIRVSAGSSYDESDATFTIIDPDSWVTFPTSGETYVRGDDIQIDIDGSVYNPGSGNVGISFLGANGAFGFAGPFYGDVDTRVINSSSFSYTNDDIVILFFDKNNPDINIMSAPITIQAQSADLTYPNGGEWLIPGQSYTINWTINTTNFISYDLELYKNGVFDQTIVSNRTSGTSYNWTCPSF